ncbi:MAG: hypothetical protein E7346_06285 [Clostridiales bacterium]|nr:hypothetical protein [Clostridiales bacterium]
MLKIRKELQNYRTGGVIKGHETTVEIIMTETELSFEFFCKNSKFFSADGKYNGPIFDGDVCEAFICTGTDITRYFEIEVAPNNCQFVYRVKNLGMGEFELDPVSEEENFLTSEVEKLGDDYRLKFSMPLDKIGYDENIGIRFNAFRIETEGGHTDLHLMALNPMMQPSFHCVDGFVKLDENLK